MATKKLKGLAVAEKALGDIALAYPEVIEEAPWGHRAFKVKKKTFVFMALEDNHLGLSTKLPHSNAVALELPFAEPTHYGLGKSGWVSASFTEKDEVPVALLREWIDESYRAIAPKKLVATLGATTLAGSRERSSHARRAAGGAVREAKPRGVKAPPVQNPAPKKAVPKKAVTKKRAR